MDLPLELNIASTWDGHPVPDKESAQLRFTLDRETLNVSFSAPFAANSPPRVRSGPCPKLWEYEVIEFFLLGEREHYLELEFGPHGHYLALQLEGRRNVIRQGMELSYQSRIEASRWQGNAIIPIHLVPTPVVSVNACAIREHDGFRQYYAHAPCPGDAPDFHALHTFTPLQDVPPASAS